jgi:hypothetical protein
MPELQAGDPAWIGPFRLRERLGDGDGDGAGGLGPLYLGQSPLAHLVTIRALRADLVADPGLRARLTRDVAAAREVSGPHVAPLVGADLSGSVPWIAWEWVPGESLTAAAGRGPGDQRAPLPWPAFATLATQLAEGIWSLHAAGVIHGDLTPGRVFLSKDGVVITGFGVSAAVAAFRATAATVPDDVLEFLSPEQAAGEEASPASDVYSLGAVLAYTLCGAGPYPARARSATGHRIGYVDPDLDDIPGFLRPLIARCLDAEPGSRPPSDGFAALLTTTIRAVPATAIAALAAVPASPSTPVPAIAGIPAAGLGGTAPRGVVMTQPALAPATASPPAAVAGPGPSASPAGKRRRLAALIGSLVAFTALIAIIVVTAVTHSDSAPGATLIRFADYKAGDCLRGNVAMNSDAPWPDFMWLVPCTDSHTYEVFYANSGYWPDSQPYPGDQAVQDAGLAECDRQFLQYDGIARVASVYTYTDVLPYPKGTWDDGARQVVCIAFGPTSGHPDGAPARASIKGSSQ